MSRSLTWPTRRQLSWQRRQSPAAGQSRPKRRTAKDRPALLISARRAADQASNRQASNRQASNRQARARWPRNRQPAVSQYSSTPAVRTTGVAASAAVADDAPPRADGASAKRQARRPPAIPTGGAANASDQLAGHRPPPPAQRPPNTVRVRPEARPSARTRRSCSASGRAVAPPRTRSARRSART